MATYTNAFEKAIDHTMFYEVGGFWNVDHPAVSPGLIDTAANRKAVGYVNDPLDNGGETKFGVAKNANTDLNITTLTWDQAKAVYYVRYWLAGKCEQMPARLAALHFDGCVNHGIKRANMFVQRALGLAADGVIGPLTLAKVRVTPTISLCNNIADQRDLFYRQIVTNNPTQGRYLSGWLRRIAEVRTFVTNQSQNFD